MGQGRDHEILLALILSGLVPRSKIIAILRSSGNLFFCGTEMVNLVERLDIAPEEVNSLFKGKVEAAKICKSLKRTGTKIIAFGEKSYPALLMEISSPPPLLFCKGSLDECDTKAVAIVGSRRASIGGTKITVSLSAELAHLGFTIVSGLARGIDTAAHRGALDAGGRTIAVLGSGIDVIYPPENKRLAECIAQSGAVITEFAPGTDPLRQNFPQRNRIISGLAVGTVVVEAAEKSGALITANYAVEQNRSVFAVPGTPGYSRSRGTNRLLKEGAKLVESVDDILEEIFPQIDSSKALSAEQAASGSLSPPQQHMIDLLSDAPAHVDELSRALGLEVHKTLEVLLTLETRGLVRSMPGKFYVREQKS